METEQCPVERHRKLFSDLLLTRQLITLAIVIPAEAGHAVKPWRYPDRSWIPDQVRDDKGWPI